MKTTDHLRTHAVNAEGPQFVGVGNLQSLCPQRLNEGRVDMENAERDQLVGVEIAEMFVLHLLRELQADIHHCHAELLLVVHGETERAHLARIIRVWLEMEEACTFAI